MKYAFEEAPVGAPADAFLDLVDTPRRPGMHRRVDVAERPLIGGQLPVRVHEAAAQDRPPARFGRRSDSTASTKAFLRAPGAERCARRQSAPAGNGGSRIDLLLRAASRMSFRTLPRRDWLLARGVRDLHLRSTPRSGPVLGARQYEDRCS